MSGDLAGLALELILGVVTNGVDQVCVDRAIEVAFPVELDVRRTRNARWRASHFWCSLLEAVAEGLAEMKDAVEDIVVAAADSVVEEIAVDMPNSVAFVLKFAARRGAAFLAEGINDATGLTELHEAACLLAMMFCPDVDHHRLLAETCGPTVASAISGQTELEREFETVRDGQAWNTANRFIEAVLVGDGKS